MAEKKSTAPRSPAPPSEGPESVWMREARALNRVPLVLGAVVVGVIGFSVLASAGDDEPPQTAAGATDEPEEATAEEEAEQQAESPPAEPDPEPETAAPEEADPVLASAATPDADDASNAAATKGGERKKTSPRRAPKKQPPIAEPVEPPAPAPAPDPAVRIKAALDEGWMRESGSTLLVFPSNTPVSRDKAASLCRRRRDAGLSGWRLASFAKLNKLRAARSLPAGTWWSSPSLTTARTRSPSRQRSRSSSRRPTAKRSRFASTSDRRSAVFPERIRRRAPVLAFEPGAAIARVVD